MNKWFGTFGIFGTFGTFDLAHWHIGQLAH